jgi:hypothetical protein
VSGYTIKIYRQADTKAARERSVAMGGELELTAVERINAAHHACEAAVRSALKHAVRCGTLLEEQKAQIPHGEWGAWLAENFDGSQRTAQVYMRLSRNREAVEEATKAQTSALLSIEGALRALQAPAHASQEKDKDDALLEHYKLKVREHADRADEEFRAARTAYEAARVWHEKFLKSYRDRRALVGPEVGAKMDEMRREAEGQMRESEELLAALVEFWSPA